MALRRAFRIGKDNVPAGERRTVDLPFSVLSNHTPVTLPVHVVHGRNEGPTMFVSAAIHGDEIIGVEIIRRILRTPTIRSLSGTLLCIPIVNVFGFISHTRYLPDRRDLNRSFPGNPNGSLAGQLAHLFTSEIVARSNYGIDLHSAAVHRTNLPQVRIGSTKVSTRKLAEAFGAPIVLISALRPGSLRETAVKNNVEILVYEAGEALRFDEFAIRAGVKGILRIMKFTGMISSRRVLESATQSRFSNASTWVRAPKGGIFRAFRTTGDVVHEDETLGVISDPFGESEMEIQAKVAGLVIGRTNLPIVNQGDALFHIATIVKPRTAGDLVGQIEEELAADPMFDEDEII